MKRWIVIEGDNGVGKDSLALALNWEIISTQIQVKDWEKSARCELGLERLEAFLRYNQKCASLAIQKDNAIVIRYWPSTIAGAYADYTINEMEMNNYIQKCILFPIPDYLIVLKCDYDTRIQRIHNRNIIENNHIRDNISQERNNRHRYALEKICSTFPNYIEIDNTHADIQDIVRFIHQEILNNTK